MKLVTILVDSGAAEEVLDRLRVGPEVLSLTAQVVESHVTEGGCARLTTPLHRVQGFVPRTRVEVLVEDADLPALVTRLKGSDAILTGHGRWWVTAVEQAERL